MADDDIKVRIAGDLADINRSLKQLNSRTRDSGKAAKGAQQDFGGFGRQLDGLKRQIAGVVGAYLGFRGIASLVRGAVRNTGEMEAAQAQLRAALVSTGEAAGFNEEQLARMAQRISSETTKSTADVTNAQTRLLTYTNLVGQEFADALQLTIDQSVRLGISVEQSAEIIGRALQEPSKAMAALGRQGFTLDASQRRLLISLEQTGRTAISRDLPAGASSSLRWCPIGADLVPTLPLRPPTP